MTIIRARYYNDGELTAILLFIYDENGAPIGMSVRDADSGETKTYYYEKNLQGDIVGVLNEAGYKVVSYTYDAWGTPYEPVYSYTSGVTSNDRANAELNPFRYRGYYYDVETGYYYLQTRYYNPEWGRFLNADGYVNANGDLLGYNMFAYCSNNPILYIDDTGCASKINFDYGDGIDIVDDMLDPGGGGGIPQSAYDTYFYVMSHNGADPRNYVGGRIFANDGRAGSAYLPSGQVYREYDIYPRGTNGRGAERIIIGDSGSAWYTPNHYRTFFKMIFQ